MCKSDKNLKKKNDKALIPLAEFIKEEGDISRGE
jgi:hypothetical protein